MSKLIDSLAKIQSLEELAEGKTVIHRIHTLAKLITTMVFLVVVISFDKYNISGLIPFIIFPVLLIAIGELKYRPVLTRLLIALPFSFFAGLSNLFLDRGTAFVLYGFPIHFGLLSFVSIILKTILSVMAVLILVSTTPMDKLAHQLILLKLPKILVMQLMLTYRYISLLMYEAVNMMTAYHLRSGRQKGIQLVHAGTFIGRLLLRSLERAEKVYIAMKCRGYSGEYQFAASTRIKTYEIISTISICVGLVLMRWVNISVLIGSMF